LSLKYSNKIVQLNKMNFVWWSYIFDIGNINIYIRPPKELRFIKLHNFTLNILKTLLILTRTAIVYIYVI
jgi:hypothetical protein